MSKTKIENSMIYLPSVKEMLPNCSIKGRKMPVENLHFYLPAIWAMISETLKEYPDALDKETICRYQIEKNAEHFSDSDISRERLFSYHSATLTNTDSMIAPFRLDTEALSFIADRKDILVDYERRITRLEPATLQGVITSRLVYDPEKRLFTPIALSAKELWPTKGFDYIASTKMLNGKQKSLSKLI